MIMLNFNFLVTIHVVGYNNKNEYITTSAVSRQVCRDILVLVQTDRMVR